MLTLLEREMAIETSLKYFSGTQGKLLFKIISNYLANTSELGSKLKNIDDTIFSNEDRLKEYSKTIISYMADIAIKTESAKTYTTGQLAKFFGVSITTINNWIKEERFIGLPPKEKHKQTRISENTLWKSSTGEFILIKDIVQMYEEQNIKQVSVEEELEILKSEIKFFENKYKGNYENTLAKKEDKTDQEQKDASEWKYLLQRIGK